MSQSLDLYMLTLILLGAIATYITRIGGYVLMTRLKSIPPRVEAGLNAVPVAVLTTLVAPAFFDGTWEVKLGMVIALLICLKKPGIVMLICGWAFVVGLRYFGLA